MARGCYLCSQEWCLAGNGRIFVPYGFRSADCRSPTPPHRNGDHAKSYEVTVVAQRELECPRNEIALLNEELRLKDERMAGLPPARRSHYQALSRMAILELRAMRGWSVVETGRRFPDHCLSNGSTNIDLITAGEAGLLMKCAEVEFRLANDGGTSRDAVGQKRVGARHHGLRRKEITGNC